jgi:hypothetical protein
MKDHTFKARSTRVLIGRKGRWWWEFKDFFYEENHSRQGGGTEKASKYGL